MVIVTVLLFTELKHTFTELAQRMKNDEMITLARFPCHQRYHHPDVADDNLIPGINLTPYSIWLALRWWFPGISYLSYLLKRYVFRESGIWYPRHCRWVVQQHCHHIRTGAQSRKSNIRPGSTRICGGDAVGSQHDVLAVSYPDRNIQYRGFDSHLITLTIMSCYVGNGR